jgi:hypothetical protein
MYWLLNLRVARMAFGLLVLSIWAANARIVLAQGAPPLLTNDPGTPGAENWEINIGAMPVVTDNASSVQVPQFDINYGVGERIQLTFEVPFVWQSTLSQPNATGWSNIYTGLKWRFLDHGEKGWSVSTFPQFEFGGSQAAVKSGIAVGGTRLLLPIEVEHPAGPIGVDVEAGYFVPLSADSREERILGFSFGHFFTPRFQAVGEIYDDKVMGVPLHSTTFDAGGTWMFHKGLQLLFMAGRSFSGNSSGQPEFLAYLGVRVLLERNGLALHSEE